MSAPRSRITGVVAITALALFALLLSPQRSRAASSCAQDRFKAAERFAQCRHKAARYNLFDKYHQAVGKCLLKYIAAWPKIHAANEFTSVCVNAARFVDNADGTVFDLLTGLYWEKKTDDDGIHDKDNLYKWSATGTPADGSAFTTFLATLNQSGSCFAGQCDWRLPTPAELQSIQSAPFPDCTGTCVDGSVFGPVSAFPCWSASTADDPTLAWNVTGVGAEVETIKSANYVVRAVRAGL